MRRLLPTQAGRQAYVRRLPNNLCEVGYDVQSGASGRYNLKGRNERHPLAQAFTWQEAYDKAVQIVKAHRRK